MKSTNTFTTITNTVFEANENLTYCWAYPQGLKGQRKRISKKEYLQAKAEDGLIRANLEAQKVVEEQDAKQELEDELLKAAENPEITVEKFAKMVEEAYKPKAKKSTKKAAYQSRIVIADDKVADVTLTEKQVDFMRHLSDTCFWEDGVESVIWIDCLCDDIKGQFAGKPMTVGAMISTLCEKDLGLRTTCRRENRKCVSFELTELGQLVAKELGLN